MTSSNCVVNARVNNPVASAIWDNAILRNKHLPNGQSLKNHLFQVKKADFLTAQILTVLRGEGWSLNILTFYIVNLIFS